MSKRRTHYGKSPTFVQKYNFDENLKNPLNFCTKIPKMDESLKNSKLTF